MTDFTHLLANSALVALGTFALVIVVALPLLWLRTFDVERALPTEMSLAVAVVVVSVANYWGHRLTHEIPYLWRFHSVHHSIELMDWAPAARLHPIDSAFTQAFTVLPLLLLGYDAGVFASVAVFVTLLAIFQHANVRLRFPGLRWVVNTPEWHHWHHAATRGTEQELRPTRGRQAVRNRLPPEGRRPDGFGVDDPVPAHRVPRPPARTRSPALAHCARDPRGAARRRRRTRALSVVDGRTELASRRLAIDRVADRGREREQVRGVDVEIGRNVAPLDERRVLRARSRRGTASVRSPDRRRAREAR